MTNTDKLLDKRWVRQVTATQKHLRKLHSDDAMAALIILCLQTCATTCSIFTMPASALPR